MNEEPVDIDLFPSRTAGLWCTGPTENRVPFTGTFVEVSPERCIKVIRSFSNGRYHSLVGPSYFAVDNKEKKMSFDVDGTEISLEEFKRRYLMAHLKTWNRSVWTKKVISLLDSISETAIITSYDELVSPHHSNHPRK